MWPANESCLYGAGEAQREAQWVRQMAKAGPVEQFIGQTQPFLLQGPDTCSPCNLSEPLTREGCVGKATMNAHTSETMEFYEAKNILKESKVHCEKDCGCLITIPCGDDGTRASVIKPKTGTTNFQVLVFECLMSQRDRTCHAVIV